MIDVKSPLFIIITVVIILLIVVILFIAPMIGLAIVVIGSLLTSSYLLLFNDPMMKKLTVSSQDPLLVKKESLTSANQREMKMEREERIVEGEDKKVETFISNPDLKTYTREENEKSQEVFTPFGYQDNVCDQRIVLQNLSDGKEIVSEYPRVHSLIPEPTIADRVSALMDDELKGTERREWWGETDAFLVAQ